MPFEQSNRKQNRKNNWKYTTASTIGFYLWIIQIIFWLKTPQKNDSKTEMNTKENAKLVYK